MDVRADVNQREAWTSMTDLEKERKEEMKKKEASLHFYLQKKIPLLLFCSSSVLPRNFGCGKLKRFL